MENQFESVLTKVVKVDEGGTFVVAKKGAIERGLFGGKLQVGDKLVTETGLRLIVSMIHNDVDMPSFGTDEDPDLVVYTYNFYKFQDAAFLEPFVRFKVATRGDVHVRPRETPDVQI